MQIPTPALFCLLTLVKLYPGILKLSPSISFKQVSVSAIIENLWVNKCKERYVFYWGGGLGRGFGGEGH